MIRLKLKHRISCNWSPEGKLYLDENREVSVSHTETESPANTESYIIRCIFLYSFTCTTEEPIS